MAALDSPDLQAELTARLTDLAEELLGPPTFRSQPEWRWGRHGSLAGVIAGAKAGGCYREATRLYDGGGRWQGALSRVLDVESNSFPAASIDQSVVEVVIFAAPGAMEPRSGSATFSA
jgi:hypothetical protein